MTVCHVTQSRTTSVIVTSFHQNGHITSKCDILLALYSDTHSFSSGHSSDLAENAVYNLRVSKLPTSFRAFHHIFSSLSSALTLKPVTSHNRSCIHERRPHGDSKNFLLRPFVVGNYGDDHRHCIRICDKLEASPPRKLAMRQLSCLWEELS